MDLVSLLVAPFAIGWLWGRWRGRRDRFSWPELVVAPIFSSVLIVGSWLLLGLFKDTSLVNPNIPVWESLMYTFVFYGGGYSCFAAAPALVGCLAGQLGKLRVFRHDQSVRPSGSGDGMQGAGRTCSNCAGDINQDAQFCRHCQAWLA